jgi:carbamoyl-phosphate synthase/aspartate carbamoyltransferase
MKNPSDQRLFAIANAMHKGYTVDQIFDLTNIDRWFLNRLMNIVMIDKDLHKYTAQTVPPAQLMHAKKNGFSDRQIGSALGTSELAVRKLRVDAGITPFVKQIDTGLFLFNWLTF